MYISLCPPLNNIIMLLLLIAVALIHVNVVSAIKYNNQQQELFVYENKIKILHQILFSECPSYVEAKREIHRDISVTLEVAKKLYIELEQDLIECRKSNSRVFNISTTTTTPSTTTTTPSTTTTTVQPVPEECLIATNLTQSWRLDHKGSNIRPGGPHSDSGYACDLHKDLHWFRFSGDGGM